MPASRRLSPPASPADRQNGQSKLLVLTALAAFSVLALVMTVSFLLPADPDHRRSAPPSPTISPPSTSREALGNGPGAAGSAIVKASLASPSRAKPEAEFPEAASRRAGDASIVGTEIDALPNSPSESDVGTAHFDRRPNREPSQRSDLGWSQRPARREPDRRGVAAPPVYNWNPTAGAPAAGPDGASASASEMTSSSTAQPPQQKSRADRAADALRLRNLRRAAIGLPPVSATDAD